MSRFEITIIKEFEGTEDVSALEYAEDWAYTVSDKCECKVKELEEIE